MKWGEEGVVGSREVHKERKERERKTEKEERKREPCGHVLITELTEMEVVECIMK